MVEAGRNKRPGQSERFIMGIGLQIRVRHSGVLLCGRAPNV